MNILFITADQWRAECLSILDHPNIKTPNLDAMAGEGVLFRRHYAQATPCSPSRASMHTGTYLHNHRVCINGTPFEARQTNWALETRNAGYNPYLIGYTDTARDPRGLDANDPRLKHYSEPLPGIETDTYFLFETPQNWVQDLTDKGYDIPDDHWDLYAQEKPGRQWEDGGEAALPLVVSTQDHETCFLTNQCIDWIGKQKSPWICHLSLLRPHPPFVAPEPYNRLYDPADLEDCNRAATLEQEAEQHPWLKYQLSREKHCASPDPKMVRRLKSSYYGLMSEVDDNLGRLFNYLKENGLWDDTLIIFTTDHGEQMGDHWMMSKSGYFDASYHIPLIIRDPRKSANHSRGSQVDKFTELVDIMPTILDSLNIDQPSQCDGHSLLPFINEKTVPSYWRREVHWEYDFREVIDPKVESVLGLTQHQCALNVIRDERYKYVHFTALPPLFFDLKSDPGEFNNLAQNPEYQSLVLRYAQKLISWRMNHDDRSLSETYLSERGPVTRSVPVHG